VINIHLKAARTEEADTVKELLLSKCGRKSNHTIEAVLQAALDVEEHCEVGRTEEADILTQLVWSRHENFDR
jgi:hypothetical protein